MEKTNNVFPSYEDWLIDAIEKLNVLRKEKIHLAKLVIGQTLFKEDLYVVSIIDKNIRLIDGFIELLKERNLTCAGILLRVQMDNCMRTYALYIAENKEQVIDSIFNNEIQLNKLNAKNGKRMNDAYLKNEMNKIDSRFKKVYEKASGYIHHSEVAFYTIASTDEPYLLNVSIGHPLPSNFDSVIVECTDAFIYFLNIQQKLISPVIKSKIKYDEEDQNY